jgi:hypothetical protein
MIFKTETGRVVEIESVGGSQDDFYIASAYYEDTPGEAISDKDLDYLQEYYASELYEMWFERCISQAEDYAEGDR